MAPLRSPVEEDPEVGGITPLSLSLSPPPFQLPDESDSRILSPTSRLVDDYLGEGRGKVGLHSPIDNQMVMWALLYK
jgi:hypothetical protein